MGNYHNAIMFQYFLNTCISQNIYNNDRSKTTTKFIFIIVIFFFQFFYAFEYNFSVLQNRNIFLQIC